MDNVFEENHCGIEILNVEQALKEPAMLAAILAKTTRWVGDRTVINVSIGERREGGWLEGFMHVRPYSGSNFYLACIQREEGAEFEFHS